MLCKLSSGTLVVVFVEGNTVDDEEENKRCCFITVAVDPETAFLLSSKNVPHNDLVHNVSAVKNERQYLFSYEEKATK